MQRILVATDLTARCNLAIARACKLAFESGAQLRFVHAVPSSISEEQERDVRRAIRDQIQTASGEQRAGETDPGVDILVGKPEHAILQAADDFGADLVVLGGHGQPRFRDAVFGTTAGHVVGHRVPILIVQNVPAAPYRRLLIAADEGDVELLVRAASTISQPAEISVVHACDSIMAELLGPVPGLPDPSDEFALRQRTRGAAAASGMPDSVIVHSIIGRGDARDVVFRASTAVEPELLVLGTHGQHGLRGLLIGSNADAAIFDSPSDIMVVPLGTEAQA